MSSDEEFLRETCDTDQTYTTTKLFCFPAMSNYNGKKYPLKWISQIKTASTSNFVLLDAAAFVGTNYLNLTEFQPDFVVLSFYKMFGYPTGLGALLIKNTSEKILKRNYFGGGTVDLALVRKNMSFMRKPISQKYEDGTIDYLGKYG